MYEKEIADRGGGHDHGGRAATAGVHLPRRGPGAAAGLGAGEPGRLRLRHPGGDGERPVHGRVQRPSLCRHHQLGERQRLRGVALRRRHGLDPGGLRGLRRRRQRDASSASRSTTACSTRAPTTRPRLRGLVLRRRRLDPGGGPGGSGRPHRPRFRGRH